MWKNAKWIIGLAFAVLIFLAKVSAISHVINATLYGDEPHSMQDVVAMTNRGLPKQLDSATILDKLSYDETRALATYHYRIDDSRSLKSLEDVKRSAAQSVCGQLLDKTLVKIVRYEYFLTSSGTVKAFEITQKDCP